MKGSILSNKQLLTCTLEKSFLLCWAFMMLDFEPRIGVMYVRWSIPMTAILSHSIVKSKWVRFQASTYRSNTWRCSPGNWIEGDKWDVIVVTPKVPAYDEVVDMWETGDGPSWRERRGLFAADQIWGLWNESQTEEDENVKSLPLRMRSRYLCQERSKLGHCAICWHCYGSCLSKKLHLLQETAAVDVNRVCSMMSIWRSLWKLHMTSFYRVFLFAVVVLESRRDGQIVESSITIDW